MPRYRRLFIRGGTYFFTANLVRRDSRLLVEHINALRTAYREAARRQPFETLAICVLPDHLHCIWTLPADDTDFPGRWRRIKTAFSRAVPRTVDPTSSRTPGERGIWQRRYREHVITDSEDLAPHVEYIHHNPVKHGLVADVDEWPYSSWHRWMKNGGSLASAPDRLRVGEAE